jgi:deoxyadenosine/deoxycytidine kinase
VKHRYIAVEGPIGVGKTSLVERLCSRLDAVKIQEDVDNPFLDAFYRDQPGAAFQTQLFFLLSRFQQQQELVQRNLFDEFTISDYLFQKDKIFAYLTLDEGELLIYERLYNLLEPQVPKPDLVIYLSGEDDVLKRRIRGRNRGYERRISDPYVHEMNEAYKHFFHYYTASPLLVINTSTIDFVKHEDELDDLVRQIERMDRGVRYYVPLGSAG